MPEAIPDTTTTDENAAKPVEPINWWHEIRSILLLIFAVLCIHSLLAKPFYIPSISMMPTMLVGDQLVVSKYAYGWSYASPSFDVLPKMKGRIWGTYPTRGDVVIIDHPVTGDEYIKRVIGLPGDRLSISNGALTINGVAVKREQQPDLELLADLNSHCQDFPGRTTRNAAGQEICALPIIRETLPNGVRYATIDDGAIELDNILNPANQAADIRVPDGHVFLMGDNRDHSADSRATFDQKGLGGPVPIENIGGRAEFITFSMDGNTKWYNPLSWFSSMREGRSGTTLRPERPAPKE
jgi:signal peptidase I